MKKKNVLFAVAAVALLTGTLLAVYGYPARIVGWKGMGSRRNTTEFEVSVPSPDAAAVFQPGTDNNNNLGSATNRFASAYATNVIASTATFAVRYSTAPRSANPLVAIVPARPGELVFDGTDNELCMSTAPNSNAWVRVSTPTANVACLH